MDAVWAGEVLRERGGSLSARQLYYVTLMDTGDRGKAEDAWARRAQEEMKAGRTPEPPD